MELRGRVRARAEELGFRPTRPRRRTYNLCAVLDLEFDKSFRISGFMEAVVEGVYAFCEQIGAEFSIFGEASGRLEGSDLVRELYERNADAAVIVGCVAQRKYFQNLEKNRFPFSCVYDGPEGRTVHVDNAAAGRIAFEHLAELGHRKIAVARYLGGRIASSQRFLGFVQATGRREHDRHSVIELIPTGDDIGFEWGRQILLDWMAGGRPYSAIFCLSEKVALGILSAASVERVRIPEDLAVLACGDTPVGIEAAPPLSVVGIPDLQAGIEAARFAWNLLHSGSRGPDRKADGESPDAQLLLPVTNLIARHSTVGHQAGAPQPAAA